MHTKHRVNLPALQQDGALVRTSQPPWSLVSPVIQLSPQKRAPMQFASTDNKLAVRGFDTSMKERQIAA